MKYINNMMENKYARATLGYLNCRFQILRELNAHFPLFLANFISCIYLQRCELRDIDINMIKT